MSLTALAPLAGTGVKALGTALASPPSTAVSGGNPHDAKQFQINVTPTNVNLGELLQQLTGGPPENGGFGLSPKTLQPISTSNLSTGSLISNPIFLLPVLGLLGFVVVRAVR